MAIDTAGDGPQYDERNPAPERDRDSFCAECGLDFDWTHLIGTEIVRTRRQSPACALCENVCTDCHGWLHEAREAALEPQARADAAYRERGRDADLIAAGAERVRRLLGLDAEGHDRDPDCPWGSCAVCCDRDHTTNDGEHEQDVGE